MGLSISRMGGSSSHLATPHRRRPSSIGRTFSALFICGAAREMEDYAAELMVDSAEQSDHGKSELTRKHSGMSRGCRADLAGIKTENVVSASNVEAGDKEECLFESREAVESNETASQPSSSGCVSTIDNVIDSSANGGSSQLVEALIHSNSRRSHGSGDSSSSELSDESIVSFDFLNSECSSVASDSPTRLYISKDDGVHEVGTSSSGLQESERAQNISSSNYAEINGCESRRNSRRLFRDAFSRRTYRRTTYSRGFGFSSNDSDHLRPDNRWRHDFSGDFFGDERQGDIRSRRSNEPRLNSTSEIWGSDDGSIDHQTAVCPRGIHPDGPCSCQLSLASDEAVAQAEISRVVLLAEALLEVLDQIYRQPMMLSSSTITLPAPDSVVDSFPVQIYHKAENAECSSDVSQCYICLDEYEEGDEIRVLPCQHEYHMSCVDKWLKEVHGVCPLCRGLVREGLTGTSKSDQDSISL